MRRLACVAAALAVVALAWPLIDRADFPYRAATPTPLDVALGTATIALVLEATRRTAGWSVAITAALFLVYAYVGPLLDLVGLDAIAHRSKAGHRVRLLVAGGSHPRFSRNTGTEEPPLTAHRLVPSTHTVSYGNSRLVLPT